MLKLHVVPFEPQADVVFAEPQPEVVEATVPAPPLFPEPPLIFARPAPPPPAPLPPFALAPPLAAGPPLLTPASPLGLLKPAPPKAFDPPALIAPPLPTVVFSAAPALPPLLPAEDRSPPHAASADPAQIKQTDDSWFGMVMGALHICFAALHRRAGSQR